MSENQQLTNSRQRNGFSTLRRLAQERAPRERCDVCNAELEDDHPHLFEPTTRQLMCTCEECLVSVGSQADTKYRRVPRQARYLPDFQLTEAQWDSLLIPVGSAFFFYSTPAQKMLAFYPSPAGATESLLGLEAWQELVAVNPILNEMQPDVEALLVNRMKGAAEHYLAPIDRCYELVGLIRVHWRGLSGGSEVWDEIVKFYARLKEQSS